jgi:hypothetical protein
MEQYIFDRLIEEIRATTLFDDEGKIALENFATLHRLPLYDAELTELLQTLIDFRMKEETRNAQSYSVVRSYIEPLLVKIKDNTKLTEAETKTLLDGLNEIKTLYHDALIKD